jgi:hypothetical protein
LLYFTSEEEKELKGEINLNEISEINHISINENESQFMFNITTTNKRVYQLEAFNEDDKKTWMENLKKLSNKKYYDQIMEEKKNEIRKKFENQKNEEKKNVKEEKKNVKEEKKEKKNEEKKIVDNKSDDDEKIWNDFVNVNDGFGWIRLKTKEGRVYFANKSLQKSQWDKPKEFIDFINKI